MRRCAECSGRRLAFASARSAIVYDARARALVRAWKEHGRRGLARDVAVVLGEVVPATKDATLVPVPGDPERSWERGDVPARSLAVELGSLWEAPVLDVLRRTRTLRRQRGLPLAERRRNAHRSVIARAEVPTTVCVIDDVYTSGATADACARACRAAGARVVEVVTFARAVR